MASVVLSKMKKRPFLVVSVAGASLMYVGRRRRNRFPDGEIWLDMDLSRPLSKTPPGVDLSFLSGDEQPLYVRDVVDALEMAAKDNKVRGVLGRFSYRSWGGGYLACVQEVRDAVTKFRNSGYGDGEDEGDGDEDGAGVAGKADDGQQRKKFTIAVADTFGDGRPAVGEYFLASAFEKVLVQKSGYVGLTGSGGQKLFFKGFFDKYGMKPEVFAREEYKSAAESLVKKAYSKHEREAITSLLTSMIDDVADGVAASRGFEKREDVYAIMQDCPLPAKLALAANLIDGIMYEHDVKSIMEAGFKYSTVAGGDAVAEESTEDSLAKLANDNENETNVLSTFAGSVFISAGEMKCKRVSMRDYIQRMRQNRAAKRSFATEDLNILYAAKGATNAPPKNVALVNVNGAITRSAEGATSSALCKLLQQIIDDPTVGAVVLRVDSPGGSAVASDSIAAAVRSVRAAGKPVVCSMGDLAASGGYMIAAACDTIMAQPTTITGSIGVIAAKVSVQRLLKDWGIEVDSIELSENHLAFSPFQEFTPKQRSLVDKRVGEIYEDFVGDVAAGRKLSVEEVLKVAKGRVWTGRQALERGLVDELGGLNCAIAIAKKAAGLPEGAHVVATERKSLAQAVKGLMFGGGNATEPNGGVRDVVLAFAYAVVGEEAMKALRGAVFLFASADDLTKGKMPSGRTLAGRGELEIDVEDC